MPVTKESKIDLTGPDKTPTKRAARSTSDLSLTLCTKFFDADGLPTEILCQILDDLNNLDDKPPKALCCFMRVSRRFRDIAYTAHELWAPHVLAPLRMREKVGLSHHERHVISLVSMLAERSKPALLSLQLPTGIMSDHQYSNLLRDLLPSLLRRARCVSANVGLLDDVVAFWNFLQLRDMASLDTLSVSASWLTPTFNLYAQSFPFASLAPYKILDLPSLYDLRLVNLIPPCPFRRLRSLHLKFDDVGLEPSTRDFLLYLRGTPQLTHLVLDQCLLDATGDVHWRVELPRLVRVQLTCAPKPCAFFLEHVDFPTTTVIVWNDTRTTREPVYDLTRMMDALREHLNPIRQYPYSASLRISDKESPVSSDNLKNETWSLWSDGPHVTFTLYHGNDQDDQVLRLEFKGYRNLSFLANRLSHLVQPSCISSMTIACMDNIANSFVSRHASDIIHSFPALTDFTWFNLTTPENLEPIIRAVLDPSNMPRLRSLRVRELGQRKRSPWGINPSVITLCKGLRTRRQAECPLIRVPRIDTVVSLRSGSDKTTYKRGAVMARGERLNELWDMLAEAQSC